MLVENGVAAVLSEGFQDEVWKLNTVGLQACVCLTNGLIFATRFKLPARRTVVRTLKTAFFRESGQVQ